MPIFMDRHELPEPVSQKDLAMAHYQDLLIQEEFGIKTMTYWHNHDGKTAFCLIDAPDAETLKALHAASHGLVPSEVIEVDPGDVVAILGRTTETVSPDPEHPEDNLDEYAASHDSAFRVIMFTDLKDSTLMNSELGEEKALELLHTHNKLIRNVIGQHKSNEVKHTGDGFMIAFLDIEDALSGAFDIQSAFSEYNHSKADEALYVRIGLASGEPVFESNDFFGLTVNLASRLCDHSKAGNVLVSSDIYQSGVETSYNFVDMGKTMLKGFIDEVPVYKVTQ